MFASLDARTSFCHSSPEISHGEDGMDAYGNSLKFAHGKLQLLILAIAIGSLSGCAWVQDNFGGEGFQPWNSEIGQNVRAKKKQDAPEHSGFFLDRKAQQIEENLGGGFN